MVKYLPAMQETGLQFLSQKDPLGKRMATHSNILAWRIPWIEEPGELLCPWGHKESDTTKRLTLSLFLSTVYNLTLKLLFVGMSF